jgi:hypothetical protein
VEQVVALAVGHALEQGGQPCRVLVGIPAYRALVARDGLRPRGPWKAEATSCRIMVLGFDLPVDCDRHVADDNANCTYVYGHAGSA